MSEQNSIEDITLEDNDIPNLSDVVNYNPLGDNVEEKDYQNYIDVAWVNYDWLDSSWEIIQRWAKLKNCFSVILNHIENGKVVNGNYSYLLPIQRYFIQNKEVTQDANKLIQYLKSTVPHWYKVLFKIKD